MWQGSIQLSEQSWVARRFGRGPLAGTLTVSAQDKNSAPNASPGWMAFAPARCRPCRLGRAARASGCSLARVERFNHQGVADVRLSVRRGHVPVVPVPGTIRPGAIPTSLSGSSRACTVFSVEATLALIFFAWICAYSTGHELHAGVVRGTASASLQGPREPRRQGTDGRICSMTHVFIAVGRSCRNSTMRVPTRLGSSTLMTWPAFGRTSISHPAM
jgi:hypothetical protein